MSKIYRVTIDISIDTLAYGNSPAQACENAQDNFEDILEDTLFARPPNNVQKSMHASEFVKGQRLPERWDDGCIPWGDNNSSVRELLDEEGK